MQVKVSLSLRLWWIASGNPPYANIPYRLNRRMAVGKYPSEHRVHGFDHCVLLT